MNAPAHYPHKIIPTVDLKPYAKNARQHSAAQIAQLVKSIETFGFTNPLLIDEDHNIIAGHGRLEAALRLAFKAVPCIIVTGLNEEQRRALVIADNQLALGATWNEEVLASELRSLSADLQQLVGFSDAELTKLLKAAAPTDNDPDAVPPEPEVIVSQPGDVWLLGNHRIMCGDSTNAENVAALLNGSAPLLMVTDPPYGVNYDPAWRLEKRVNNDSPRLGKVENDDNADWREAWRLFPGDVAYVWHSGLNSTVVETSLLDCGFETRAQIIWAKEHFVFSRGHYHWQHEACWYAVKEKKTAHWVGDRSQTTVWNINRMDDKGWGHGTQKPVACMQKPIENNSKRGDAVYEPFSGSGTTIIAAEMTDRCCYAMELNPAYVDVAVIRWQLYTGLDAVLESTGQSFNEAKFQCEAIAAQ